LFSLNECSCLVLLDKGSLNMFPRQGIRIQQQTIFRSVFPVRSASLFSTQRKEIRQLILSYILVFILLSPGCVPRFQGDTLSQRFNRVRHMSELASGRLTCAKDLVITSLLVSAKYLSVGMPTELTGKCLSLKGTNIN
jgi:hypothetical protein